MRSLSLSFSAPNAEGATYLCSHAALRRLHNPSVVPQHIEPLLLAHELFRGFFDRRQISQIDLQELESPTRLGKLGFNLPDRRRTSFRRASRDIDGPVLLVQDLRELEPAARVATCDYEDLREGSSSISLGQRDWVVTHLAFQVR